ncbi:MAG: hypothetical protein AAF202_07445 [Pseudomonadota bacterium]
MKSIHMNQNGSAILEASLCISALLAMGLALTMAAYLIFAKVTLNHFGYQALVCVAEDQSPKLCRARVLKKLKKTLPFGQLGRFHLRKQSFKFQVILSWRVGGIPMLRLPLRTLHYRKTLKYQKGF